MIRSICNGLKSPIRQISKNSIRRNTNFEKPSPFERIITNEGPVDKSQLWKPVTFTFAFGMGSFATVTIWEYEAVRSRAIRSNTFAWGQQKFNDSKKRTVVLREDVKQWWSKLAHGDRVFIPLCALNVLVFGLWRIPRPQPVFVKYFCSNPAARAVCWPMFLSTFSHYSMFHIFANMYVLRSFSSAAVMAMGKEQFVGLYLTSGVVASLASYLYKAGFSHGGLSLGASGAIMGILAYVCVEFPDTQLNIIFLPTLTFSAGMAIKFIMGLDLAGIILGWKIFDHAAHLGGALFGLFWSYYGSQHIWPKRNILQKEYHKFRSSNK